MTALSTLPGLPSDSFDVTMMGVDAPSSYRGAPRRGILITRKARTPRIKQPEQASPPATTLGILISLSPLLVFVMHWLGVEPVLVAIIGFFIPFAVLLLLCMGWLANRYMKRRRLTAFVGLKRTLQNSESLQLDADGLIARGRRFASGELTLAVESMADEPFVDISFPPSSSAWYRLVILNPTRWTAMEWVDQEEAAALIRVCKDFWAGNLDLDLGARATVESPEVPHLRVLDPW